MKISELEVDVIKNKAGGVILDSSTGGVVWSSDNHGAGSGLDADLLDGKHASEFATSAQGTKADNAIPVGGLNAQPEIIDIVDTALDTLTRHENLKDSVYTKDVIDAGQVVLDAVKKVDGVGSGLDADAIHGKTGAELNTELSVLGVKSNIMTKAEFEALAAGRREEFAGSGKVSIGLYDPGDTFTATITDTGLKTWDISNNANIAKALTITGTRGGGKSVFNVNGNLVDIQNINSTTSNGSLNFIDFSEPNLPTVELDSSNLSKDYKQGDNILLTDTNRELVSNGAFYSSGRISSYTYSNGSNSITIEDNANTISGYVVIRLNLVSGVRYRLSFKADKTVDVWDGHTNFIQNSATGTVYGTNFNTLDTQEFMFEATTDTNIVLYASDDIFTYSEFSIKQVRDQKLTVTQDITAGTDVYAGASKFIGIDSFSRQDLVFLESWHEDISEKGIVYPYGNVQYRGSDTDGLAGIVDGSFTGADTYSLFGNWQNTGALIGKGYIWSPLSEVDKIKFASNPENNIYLDGDKYIQVRYRVRVIKGLANTYAMDTQSTTLYYLGSSVYGAVAVKGAYPLTADYQTYLNGIASPRNVYINQASGYNEYPTKQNGEFGADTYNSNYKEIAIPIALVQRRNAGIYDPVFNSEGCAKIYDGGNAKFWYESSLITSVADCFNPNMIATVNINDTANASTLTDLNNGTDDSAIYKQTGLIVSTVSGRPDDIFADEVNERDVEDLRMNAHKVSSSDISREMIELLKTNSVRSVDVKGRLCLGYKHGVVVPLGASGDSDDVHTYTPTVILDNGTYKMWYSGHDGSNARIHYATSTDGISWTKHGVVVPLGVSGDSDDIRTYYPTVILDNGTYKMWYSGYDGSNVRIHYAVLVNHDNIPQKLTTANTTMCGKVIYGDTKSGYVNNNTSLEIITNKPESTFLKSIKLDIAVQDKPVSRTVKPNKKFIEINKVLATKEDGTVIDVPYTTNTALNTVTVTSTYSDLGYADDADMDTKISVVVFYAAHSGLPTTTSLSSDVLSISNYVKVLGTSEYNLITESALGKPQLSTITGVSKDLAVKQSTLIDNVNGAIIHEPANINTGLDNQANSVCMILSTMVNDSNKAVLEILFKESVYHHVNQSSNDNGVSKYSGTLFGNIGGPAIYKHGVVVPLGADGDSDDYHTYYPTVILDNGTYKMWYGGNDGSSWRLHYATSTDGISWTKHGVVVPLGADGDSDDIHTETPTVILDNGTYKMWYSGNDGSNWRIHYLDTINTALINNTSDQLIDDEILIKQTNRLVPNTTSDLTKTGILCVKTPYFVK